MLLLHFPSHLASTNSVSLFSLNHPSHIYLFFSFFFFADLQKTEAPIPGLRSKTIMKKFVLKLDLHDGKEKQKALKTVSALPGIDSIAMDMKEKKLTVIGIVDPITTVSKLRKYWPTTVLISVGPAKEPEKPSEKKEGGEAAKPEEAGKKEEGKKEGAAGEEKKEEGKKEGDEKKEGGGGDEKKKAAPPQVIPLYDPMWEMKARGYNPHMFGYNNVPPMMTYYNPNHHHMAAYNPPMTSYYPPPPPMNTHYAHPMEENPNGTCTIV